jgi:hypothetical protein
MRSTAATAGICRRSARRVVKDIDLDGRKLGFAKLWPVGTWSLKGHWYEDLRREGKAAGREVDPPGYCHFGKFLDEIISSKSRPNISPKSQSRGRMTKGLGARAAIRKTISRLPRVQHGDRRSPRLSSMTEDEWKSSRASARRRSRKATCLLRGRSPFKLRPVPRPQSADPSPPSAVGRRPIRRRSSAVTARKCQ